MGRQASVRAKNGYWFSEAGGVGRYFGKCSKISHATAMSLMRSALAESHGGDSQVGAGVRRKAVANERSARQGATPLPRSVDRSQCEGEQRRPDAPSPTPPIQSTLSVDDLAIYFLDWVLAHPGVKAHKERSRHIQRFRESFGEIPAHAIGGSHIEAFIASLRTSHHAIDYIQKHLVSVGAMFNKGIRKGWIPPTCRPFASVDPLRLQAKTLTEDALPTDAEIRLPFQAADADRTGQMGDMTRLYHGTGARTHELIAVRAGDFQRSTRQIVLGLHKRTHTLKERSPRQVFLNETGIGIMERRCEVLDANAYVFSRPSGGLYSNVNIAERFQTVQTRAGVRPTITIYSFRHLWVSEMLMAGVDVLLVARMGGTSVATIERVYGHFRNQSYQEAQVKLDQERARRGL
jgi:integrase